MIIYFSLCELHITYFGIFFWVVHLFLLIGSVPYIFSQLIIICMHFFVNSPIVLCPFFTFCHTKSQNIYIIYIFLYLISAYLFSPNPIYPVYPNSIFYFLLKSFRDMLFTYNVCLCGVKCTLCFRRGYTFFLYCLLYSLYSLFLKIQRIL